MSTIRRGSRKKRPPQRLNRTMERKLGALFWGMVLIFLVLVGRITQINATSGNQYRKIVLSQAQQRYESRVLPSRRGDIYDRNGNLLATSNKVYNVILDCKAVNSGKDFKEPTVDALVSVLGLDEKDILDRLEDESTKESQYQILKKGISMDEKKAFDAEREIPDDNDFSGEEIQRRRNIRGVWFEEDYQRVYPFNELACDTIGFTFSRDTADWGVEGYYNSTLTGTDGRQYGYFTDDSDVEQTIVEPGNGYYLWLTLDVGIQQIVEKYVNAFNEFMGAANVGVIVEDPNTGAILAMDGGDRYDLNQPRDMSLVHTKEEIQELNKSDSKTVDALNAMWNNFCVTDAYEPGSVVKPIVMASALENGKISVTDTLICDGGQAFGANGDPYIKCAAYPDSHGEQTLAEAIAHSCNDALMQVAAKMGAEQFIKSQSLFNFGTRTGIDLPNEGTGIIHTTETMGETELACSAFGQGFTCTMIQEINAICSIINGGYYYQPYLVSKITDPEGNPVKTISPTLLKQTISANISSELRSYMKSSVDMGTSISSKVQGYSSGGKTGTAEKLPRGNGKYLVSFVGFAPVDDPQVVVYVVVDEPKADDQADSKYAQYIAQGIFSDLFPYLNILPDEVTDGYMPETELWEGFKGHIKNAADGNVDENGNLVDAEGHLIDLDGNRIDENGYLLDENGEMRTDENGEYIRSGSLPEPDDTLPESVSNENAPAPLEDDADPTVGNDMESEGVTNEEAGLDWTE